MNNMIAQVYNLLNRFYEIFNPPRAEGVKNEVVDKSVQKTLKQYKDTLKYLEMYDKGEISPPKNVAKHKNVRSYIQSL